MKIGILQRFKSRTTTLNVQNVFSVHFKFTVTARQGMKVPTATLYSTKERKQSMTFYFL